MRPNLRILRSACRRLPRAPSLPLFGWSFAAILVALLGPLSSAGQDLSPISRPEAELSEHGGTRAPSTTAQTEHKSNEEESEKEEDAEKDDTEDEPWSLFHSVFPGLEDRKTQMQGWLGQSYTWNPLSPSDRSNGTLGMGVRSNDYLFNQVGMYLHKQVDTESTESHFGYRLESMYGADARWVQSRGWDDEWQSGRFVFFSTPQVYLDWFIPWQNGITITAGRIWTPIGYEGIPAPERFFYSVTNTYMLAEPSTHLGLFAKYPLNDRWTVQLGIHRGWDVTVDNNSALAFLSVLNYQSEEKETIATLVTHYGSESDGGGDRLFLNSLMLARKINADWTYVFWTDFAFQERVARRADGGLKNEQWFGFHQQLFYGLGETTAVGFRFEWFHDDDGTRITEWLNETTLGAGDLYALTWGINQKWGTNWVFRPEIRYDFADRVKPFDGLTRNDQWTLAMDAVLKF